MSNAPLSPEITGERYEMPGSAASYGGPAGLAWGPSQGAPMFRMEPAVVETVVTRVTRTTTSFAPIQLPRIPQPENLIPPPHLSPDVYPLAREPLPDDIKLFHMNMGDQRVVVHDDTEPTHAHAESSRAARPTGWRRTLPALHVRPSAVGQRISVMKGIEASRTKEARKRPHQSSAPTPREQERTPDPSPPGSAVAQDRSTTHSPPRKRIRGPTDIQVPRAGSSALLSPLPSPDQQTPALSSPETPAMSLGTGHELAALYSLPSLVSHFDGLPDKLQQHILMQLLRRARMPTIQRVTAYATPALRRDFISTLPHELAIQVLQSVDAKTLTRATRVNKKWKRMIDSERSVWKQRLIADDLYHGQGVEEEEEALITRRYEIIDEQARMRPIKADTPDEDELTDDDEWMSDFGPSTSKPTPVSAALTPELERPVPLKHVYRRRHTNNINWFHKRPMHNAFHGHGTNVVTGLQFDRDKIVSASDDHSINIYRTRTGHLIKRLDGHEGGVWALQYLGDTLVSGSTDRTLRIWDLEKMKPTHVFHGHLSTVRCLQIVEPVLDPESGEYQPPYPIVVTGSRDCTLRVWKLPKKGEPAKRKWGRNEEGQVVEVAVPPEENPYHTHLLEGHQQAIRAIAAYGRYCVSGSYDHTVRVWDIVKGTCLWNLRGHDAKVYSVVYDRHRHRCASGSMDMTIKVWDLKNGECLHTLTGHTSLVGLLGLSPNFLVSAAADSSLRIWDSTKNSITQILSNSGGAITCFQHDEHKIVSGSDGMLKLWDVRQGRFVRDLVIGISSVWQVAFHGNLLVAASNRAGHTVFDVFDFGELDHMSGVDDDRLDALRRPPWERDNPLDPMTYQSDEVKAQRWRRGDPRATWWGPSPTPGPDRSQPGVGRRSARLAQRYIEESSTSPTPVAGPSTSRADAPQRSNAQHHHHHHHHHVSSSVATPDRTRDANGTPAAASTARVPIHQVYQGRITRSRSGPGTVHSPSPARYSARTGSTGHLGRLVLANRDSYAPVFDDDEHPSPRLATRLLSSEDPDVQLGEGEGEGEGEDGDDLDLQFGNGRAYESFVLSDDDDDDDELAASEGAMDDDIDE